MSKYEKTSFDLCFFASNSVHLVRSCGGYRPGVKNCGGKCFVGD